MGEPSKKAQLEIELLKLERECEECKDRLRKVLLLEAIVGLSEQDAETGQFGSYLRSLSQSLILLPRCPPSPPSDLEQLLEEAHSDNSDERLRDLKKLEAFLRAVLRHLEWAIALLKRELARLDGDWDSAQRSIQQHPLLQQASTYLELLSRALVLLPPCPPVLYQRLVTSGGSLHPAGTSFGRPGW